jgi:hypothetical protein
MEARLEGVHIRSACAAGEMDTMDPMEVVKSVCARWG